ncbi:MAG: hypothetical protein IKH01_06275 [Prevotella sp.]|nr:hypothetical protein [Prevotella sp.]
MRRRIPYRVCRCLPNGVVTHLEARLLKDLVNREIHPIRCAASCKRKFQKAMYLGDLCAETGHFWWARKIWLFASGLIEDKDYDDWINVWFDNNRVHLRDVISETECELLDRRCSQLWRALGHPEYDWWDDRIEYLTSRYFGTTYYYLYAEKFSCYYDEPVGKWESDMEIAEAEQETQQIFRDGQGDNQPPCSQDFTEYWHGGPHTEDFSWLTYKHGQQQKYC